MEGFKTQLLSSLEEEWKLFWKPIDKAVKQFRKNG